MYLRDTTADNTIMEGLQPLQSSHLPRSSIHLQNVLPTEMASQILHTNLPRPTSTRKAMAAHVLAADPCRGGDGCVEVSTERWVETGSGKRKWHR